MGPITIPAAGGLGSLLGNALKVALSGDNGEIDWAVWGPPLAVLVAGVVASVVTLQRIGSQGDGDRRVGDEARRIDLDSARAESVEALKQLELDRHKMAPADYDAEYRRLLGRGASAIAALDGTSTAGSVPPPTAPAPVPAPVPAAAVPAASGPAPGFAIGPEWRGALYALGFVALLYVLWTFASSNSASRGTGSMTGNLPGEEVGGRPVPQDPANSAEFKQAAEQLRAAHEANPENIDVLNDLTHLYMSHGKHQEAMVWSDKALKIDAKNKTARTYRAVLTAMMGMFDQAIMALETVLAEDPNFLEALVYKGLILLQQNQFQPAADALGKALQQSPDNSELRARYEQALQGASGGAMPAPGAPPAAGGLLAGGTITIDPAAAALLTGTETIYLSLANPAAPMPPVAAEKITGPFTFPIPFQLTTASIRAMGPGGVPPVMDLKIRVDADGNAMTKEPGLPLAIVTGVQQGTAGLAVVLTVSGTPTAAPAMPGGGAPPMAPAPAAPTGGAFASGTLTLGPGVVAKGTETVFLSLKDPAGGPPIASKKLAATFPQAFSLGPSDVLAMGGARPVPASFNVTVRLDGDGDPMTKDGPEAVAAGVAQGATGLTLELK